MAGRLKNPMNRNREVEQFNEISQSYGSFVEQDPVRNRLHYPAVISELGDKAKGKKVLDIGCGNGALDRLLAKTCEAEVVGYDAAPDSIALAAEREKVDNLGISYIAASHEEFKWPEPFDEAVSVMVLPYAKDPKDLEKFFKSAFDNLKSGGRFISVVFSPEFKNFGEVVANRKFVELPEHKVQVQFLDPKSAEMQFSADLTQFSEAEYTQAFSGAGFETAKWKTLYPNASGKEALGNEFWEKAEETQPYGLLVVEK